MPAHSRSLEEEGVVIAPTRLDDAILRDLAGRMRNPRQREADLRAQLAAGRAGAERVEALIERFGLEAYRDGLEETLDYAERRTRAKVAELEDGVREAEDVLEAADGDGAAGARSAGRDLELRLRATVDGDSLALDFDGSAEQHEGNLNCPLAVTLSACYFALRVLADGPSAVHVAMSNTLNTPLEALELEFPLRAVEYALRAGSGGDGRFRGGGAVGPGGGGVRRGRHSLLTQRRTPFPPGGGG